MNLMDKIEDDIKTHGRSVIGVLPDTADPNSAFAYTIGNAQAGLPELLALGGNSALVPALNILSRIMQSRGRFADRQQVYLGEGAKFPVCVVEAADSVKDEYTVQATNYNGRDYDVMQVVVPDPQGRFPWDAECEKPYADIIVHAKHKTTKH